MTTAHKHAFTSAKADGADATLVRPSNWNAAHNLFLSMTNRSGSAVAQFDACAVGTANDDSFTKTTTVSDTRPLVVVQDLAGIADATAGNVQYSEETTVNVQGAVTRNNWLRFCATAGKLEDTGVANTALPPPGANAQAVTGFAGPGAGTVTALLGVKSSGFAPPASPATPTTNLIFRESLVKAWAFVTLAAGVPALTSAYNISSIDDNGVGNFTVHFATNFANATYAWAFGNMAGANRLGVKTAQAVGTFQYQVLDTAGANQDDNHSLIFIGTQ